MHQTSAPVSLWTWYFTSPIEHSLPICFYICTCVCECICICNCFVFVFVFANTTSTDQTSGCLFEHDTPQVLLSNLSILKRGLPSYWTLKTDCPFMFKSRFGERRLSVLIKARRPHSHKSHSHRPIFNRNLWWEKGFETRLTYIFSVKIPTLWIFHGFLLRLSRIFAVLIFYLITNLQLG